MLTHRLNSAPFIYVANNARNFFLNLFLLNRSGLELGWSFNAPSWSISAEFVVNIAFLVAIAARKRISISLLTLAFITSMAIVLRNGLISNSSFLGIDNDIFRAMFGFCIGTALPHINSKLEETSIPTVAYDLIALASASCFLYYCMSGGFSKELDIATTAICFPALIIGSMRGRGINKILKIRALVFLGTISYSIYLVHFPVQLAVHIIGVATGNTMPYESRAFFIAFMSVTIGLSWMTYRLIEVPGKNLVRRYIRRRNEFATPPQS
jgi:peptidoglycan/LPS O-acetylase OafA/YrhL